MMDATDPLQVLAADADQQSTVTVPPPAIDQVDTRPVEDRLGPAADPTPAGVLRARMEAMRGHRRTRIFPIPDWDGLLAVRVRALTRQEWAGLQRRSPTDEELIVAATDAVLWRETIDDGWSEVPGFGPQFAQLLGMPADTPATLLLAAVARDEGAIISSIAQDILAWLTGRRSLAETQLGALAGE